MNEYDSSRMLDVLRVSHGMESTDRPEEADVLLLNTCSIREKAQEKVFSHLGVWRELKEQRPGVLIGVGGCVASQEADAVRSRAPFVDMVFGPQTLHRLPGFIDEIRARGRAVGAAHREGDRAGPVPGRADRGRHVRAAGIAATRAGPRRAAPNATAPPDRGRPERARGPATGGRHPGSGCRRQRWFRRPGPNG